MTTAQLVTETLDSATGEWTSLVRATVCVDDVLDKSENIKNYSKIKRLYDYYTGILGFDCVSINVLDNNGRVLIPLVIKFADAEYIDALDHADSQNTDTIDYREWIDGRVEEDGIELVELAMYG